MEIPLGKKDLYCNFTSFHFIIKISLHFDNPSLKRYQFILTLKSQ